MSRTAVYLRVSSEEQRQNQTIETQRQVAARYCASAGIAPTTVYADDGLSGTLGLMERPGSRQLLEDARAGKFEELLVYKLDRLGRNAREILNSVAELETCGVKVRSLTEPFDNATPSGRFLLTVLAGVAALERDNIVQRSVDGSRRLAREGAWLGGTPPFGYCVVGRGRAARLVIGTEALSPSGGMTEADVVRMIYRLAVERHMSCIQMANHLNGLGIPTRYLVEEGGGKGARRAAPLWQRNRIRKLIINPVYKGVSPYGVRNQKARGEAPIERHVPAIVSSQVWERAQEVLTENFKASRRNAKHQYLLRGLIKCGLCGITYVGTSYLKNGRDRRYYVCGGKNGKGYYARYGERCPSKSISGDLEETVWADIEEFARAPGPVLEELSRQLQTESAQSGELKEKADLLRVAMSGKQKERDAILSLYRKGRIDESVVEGQLSQIEAEESHLGRELAWLEACELAIEEAGTELRSAQTLLASLHERLLEPVTWETKRTLVETLVHSIDVETLYYRGRKVADAHIHYRFTPPRRAPRPDGSPSTPTTPSVEPSGRRGHPNYGNVGIERSYRMLSRKAPRRLDRLRRER